MPAEEGPDEPRPDRRPENPVRCRHADHDGDRADRVRNEPGGRAPTPAGRATGRPGERGPGPGARGQRGPGYLAPDGRPGVSRPAGVRSPPAEVPQPRPEPG